MRSDGQAKCFIFVLHSAENKRREIWCMLENSLVRVNGVFHEQFDGLGVLSKPNKESSKDFQVIVEAQKSSAKVHDQKQLFGATTFIISLFISFFQHYADSDADADSDKLDKGLPAPSPNTV